LIDRKRKEFLLGRLSFGEDGVYSAKIISSGQDEGIALREQVARGAIEDYLIEVSRHHSIPVMDAEVDRCLRLTPKQGVIVAVGGCWGWHWRRLAEMRPDVAVIIVELVRSNLGHASLLGTLVDKQVYLVHANAVNLPFPSDSVDVYWSVQTLQHIPDLELALAEARRILIPGGYFINYSLNNASLVRLLCRMLGKRYHVRGKIPGSFFLSRADGSQRAIAERVVGARIVEPQSTGALQISGWICYDFLEFRGMRWHLIGESSS